MEPIHYTTLFKLPDASRKVAPTQFSLADLCALEQAQIPYPANDLAEYDAEDRELENVYGRRIERRRTMFLAHLDVLWKYREEIRKDDRYRKVPIDFLYRILSGAPVPVSIGALFGLWNDPMFQSKCDCGETGFVVSFCGSPLSGCYGAHILCPHCGKNFHVGNYGDAHRLLQNARFGELVNKVYAAKRNSEKPDENTVRFETLVGDLRRKAFFESRREERPESCIKE